MQGARGASHSIRRQLPNVSPGDGNIVRFANLCEAWFSHIRKQKQLWDLDGPRAAVRVLNLPLSTQTDGYRQGCEENSASLPQHGGQLEEGESHLELETFNHEVPFYSTPTTTHELRRHDSMGIIFFASSEQHVSTFVQLTAPCDTLTLHTSPLTAETTLRSRTQVISRRNRRHRNRAQPSNETDLIFLSAINKLRFLRTSTGEASNQIQITCRLILHVFLPIRW